MSPVYLMVSTNGIRIRRVAGFASLALGLSNCGPESTESSTDDVPSILEYEFPPVQIAAGEEILDLCQSVTLNNSSPIAVNRVDLQLGAGWHHSNWFHVPESLFPGPDGSWNCNERGFDDFIAGVSGGLLIFQSTQAEQDAGQFASGTAFIVPPHSKIVGGLHLLNATSNAIETGAATMRLTTIPVDEVTTELSPFVVEYNPLDIPPRSRASFSTTCELSGDPNFQVHHLVPHYHGFGVGMRFDAVRTVGGQETVENIFTTNSSIGEPLGQSLSPAFDVSPFTHLRLTCEYDNPTDRNILFGNRDGEMCYLVGFSTRLKWAGRTDSGTNRVISTEEGMTRNEAPCSFVDTNRR